MGRPKCYPSPAARQAAYRQRLDAEMVLVNRQDLAQWDERIPRLVDAIVHAAQAGDPLATQLRSVDLGTTIDKMIAFFNQRWREARTVADHGCSSVTSARLAPGLGEISD